MKTKQLKPYLMLWSTQTLSALGSGMTSYALVLWLYLRSGSALKTALLSVCSYASYVIMSIFAGALSDRWNKKRTMLVCDLLAALSTVIVFLLIKADALNVWHLYILNALNGLMNTIQQPASEVAATLLIPKDYYQKTSGLRSFSQSLNSILTPILATALFAFAGIGSVIAVDLITFAVAFLTLLFFIHIPESDVLKPAEEKKLFEVLDRAVEKLNRKRSGAIVISTTDGPRRILLDADRDTICADNRDVAVVRVELQDGKRNFTPAACVPLKLTVDGPVRILGVGNGDPAYKEDEHPTDRNARTYHVKTFNGLAQILLQSDGGTGTATLTVEGEGIGASTREITCAR